ncbi:hypothetical protein NGA_2112620, partial [Nannochloropsis gaditana CCMP526]|uniref:uncharacterized protein n=1 Tax=Nannochloropsis gaditana (strain CCMP526) TaxID=1093141 RepID=UPI00029F7FCB
SKPPVRKLKDPHDHLRLPYCHRRGMLLAVGLVLPGRYVDVWVLLVEEAPGVKGDVALAYGALDARARLLLLTDHALEGATRRGHAGVVNQLQLVGLCESDVGEPKRALYMGPVPRGGG